MVQGPSWRTGVSVIACLAAGYFVFLCLPHGYRQLEQLEFRLKKLTPQGARVEEVRAGLSHEGIEYWERVQGSSGSLMD